MAVTKKMRSKDDLFGSSNRGLGSLEDAANICCSDVLGIKEDERVLIVTNPRKDVSQISQAIYDAVLGHQGIPTILYQPVPPSLVAVNADERRSICAVMGGLENTN